MQLAISLFSFKLAYALNACLSALTCYETSENKGKDIEIDVLLNKLLEIVPTTHKIEKSPQGHKLTINYGNPYR